MIHFSDGIKSIWNNQVLGSRIKIYVLKVVKGGLLTASINFSEITHQMRSQCVFIDSFLELNLKICFFGGKF